MTRQSGGIGAAALLLVLTLAVVATSAVTLVQTAEGHLSTEAFANAIGQCGVCFAVLLGGPMLLGLVGALVAGVSGNAPVARTETAAAASEPAKPAPPASDAALRLLALLQQEGRLVDFLLEE